MAISRPMRGYYDLITYSHPDHELPESEPYVRLSLAVIKQAVKDLMDYYDHKYISPSDVYTAKYTLETGWGVYDGEITTYILNKLWEEVIE